MARSIDYDTDCPITVALQVVGGKWKMAVLCYIRSGENRFSQLQRKMPGITQGMLATQLRSLEEDGIIYRKVYPVVPPKVEYFLTPLGEKLIPTLDAICEWGRVYMQEKGASCEGYLEYIEQKKGKRSNAEDQESGRQEVCG